MDTDVDVTLRVNGDTVTRRVEARMSLVDFLRDELGLTTSMPFTPQKVLRALGRI